MLDRVWRGVNRQVAVAALAIGIFASSVGTAGAVSGLSSPGGDAAQAVYPETPGVLGGAEDEGGQGEQDDTQGGETLGGGEERTDGVGGANALQPSRQLTAAGAGDNLPFSGLATIPLLLVGALLLVLGGVLRRRPHKPSS